MGRGGTYHKYYYSRKEACWRIYVGILTEQSQEAGASWLIFGKAKTTWSFRGIFPSRTCCEIKLDNVIYHVFDTTMQLHLSS